MIEKFPSPIVRESVVSVSVSVQGIIPEEEVVSLRGLLTAFSGQNSKLHCTIDIVPQPPDRPLYEADFHQAAEVLEVKPSVGTQVFNSMRRSALFFETSDELTGKIVDEAGIERTFVHSALVRHYHETGRYAMRVGKTGKKILEHLVSTLKVDEQEITSEAAR